MKKPRYTTHVKLETKYNGRKCNSLMLTKDMDCIAGVPGKVTYLRKMHKGFKKMGTFNFDGKWPIIEG
jgi:hypothetical protein|tara:strand:+ start:173 stop:376 length:204 start_codon:yes stop_codon:yes gene_type:complete